jgi:hypothetical protein
MCKRHRAEPPGKFRPVRLLRQQIPQQILVISHCETIAYTTLDNRTWRPPSKVGIGI